MKACAGKSLSGKKKSMKEDQMLLQRSNVQFAD